MWKIMKNSDDIKTTTMQIDEEKIDSTRYTSIKGGN
jgi:hypothetical protein